MVGSLSFGPFHLPRAALLVPPTTTIDSAAWPETGFWEPINNLASLVKQMLETLYKEKGFIGRELVRTG
jgi:hypothetical protein